MTATERTCATCKHSRPHGAGFVRCTIASRRMGEPVQFFCSATAQCAYRPEEWAPAVMPEVTG